MTVGISSNHRLVHCMSSYSCNFWTTGKVEENDVLLWNVPTAIRRHTDNNCVSEVVLIALITIINYICGEEYDNPCCKTHHVPVCAEELSTIAPRRSNSVFVYVCAIYPRSIYSLESF